MNMLAKRSLIRYCRWNNETSVRHYCNAVIAGRPIQNSLFNKATTTSVLTNNATAITIKRKIHFLPFLGIWGAKHLTSWTIYNACKVYGWPKLYRRLLEQNRIINNQNPKLQQSTKNAIRMAIEAPPRFVAQLSTQYTNVVLPFLQQIVSVAEHSSETIKMPRFLVAMIKYIVDSQKPLKLLKDLAEAGAGKSK